MTFKSFTLGLALMGLTACATPTVSSEDGSGDMSMEDMMAAMMAAGTPGAEHEGLAESVGSWTIATRSRMGAGAPLEEGTASSEIQMILGGRYMHETFRMDFEGMPFEGNLILGFNNVTQQYESIWIDSMSTGFSLMTGHQDADGSFDMRGTMHDTRTPEGRPGRFKTWKNDDGTAMFQMFDTDADGNEYMIMENRYTRR